MTRVLQAYDEQLAVVRLGPGADLPAWAGAGSVFSVTATAAETSIVCAHRAVPRKARHEGPFLAFAVEGPLDLGLTGVLHELLAPLASAEVPVFVVSTFDTDWVLVPADDAPRAEDAWRRAGHDVRAAASPTEPDAEGPRA